MANSTSVHRSFTAETKPPFELLEECCTGWRERWPHRETKQGITYRRATTTETCAEVNLPLSRSMWSIDEIFSPANEGIPTAHHGIPRTSIYLGHPLSRIMSIGS
jgi:hypothetical protein